MPAVLMLLMLLSFPLEAESPKKDSFSGSKSRSAKFRNFGTAKPLPGEAAPDFTLKTLDSKSVRLSELAAKSPVILEFGSYT